jgi:hypothetical protein
MQPRRAALFSSCWFYRADRIAIQQLAAKLIFFVRVLEVAAVSFVPALAADADVQRTMLR